MHDILIVLVHSIVTVVRLIKPGGLRAVVAESVLTRHQLLILNRSRKRAPNLRVSDRIIAGLCTLIMHPSRMRRCGIVLKPSTLLHFHHVLTKRKYHMLFSSKRGFSACAALALALAAVGMYSVVACAVSLHTREFALRIALGASNARILREILTSAMMTIALGMGDGLAL